MTDQIINEWIKRAADDESNARSIIKHRDGTPSIVCFLSQQAAEKYLKVLLLIYDTDFPKVHDLIELANLLNVHIAGLSSKLKDDLILLRPYYIATRYPADIPLEDFTWKMAEEALTASDNIRQFAHQHLDHQ